VAGYDSNYLKWWENEVIITMILFVEAMLVSMLSYKRVCNTGAIILLLPNNPDILITEFIYLIIIKV